MPHNAELEIIGTLYDAAMGRQSWDDVSVGLLNLVGGESLRLTVQYAPTNEIEMLNMQGITQKEVGLYVANYIPHDLWLWAGMKKSIINEVFINTDFVSDYDWQNGCMYTDLCRHHTDTFHALLAVAGMPGQGQLHTGIHRPRKAPAFRREAARGFQRILPHVARAAYLQSQLADARREAGLSLAALDKLTLGVVQLTADGRTTLVNAAARNMLNRRDGLSFVANTVRAEARRDDDLLRRALAQASGVTTRTEATTLPDSYLQIARPSGLRSYAVMVVPMGLDRVLLTARRASVMMLITDPEAGPLVDNAALASLFGLTPAEARVVGLLITGCALPAIARRLGIGFETARTHLARVRAKTETTSQVDLVRLVLSTLAPVASRGPRA